MIYPAINTIRQELVTGGITADIGNVSEIVNTPGAPPADLIISLINIEENRISKDPNNYVRQGTGIVLKNPAVHLYLTLLFTSVRGAGAYGLSLQDIQRVIGVFQKKFVFDHANTPALDPGIDKLVLDMVSLNLQQLHEIWSVLGGRYYPSVAYRMRMVTIDYVSNLAGPLITEINADYFKIENEN